MARPRLLRAPTAHPARRRRTPASATLCNPQQPIARIPCPGGGWCDYRPPMPLGTTTPRRRATPVPRLAPDQPHPCDPRSLLGAPPSPFLPPASFGAGIFPLPFSLFFRRLSPCSCAVSPPSVDGRPRGSADQWRCPEISHQGGRGCANLAWPTLAPREATGRFQHLRGFAAGPLPTPVGTASWLPRAQGTARRYASQRRRSPTTLDSGSESSRIQVLGTRGTPMSGRASLRSQNSSVRLQTIALRPNGGQDRPAACSSAPATAHPTIPA